MAKISARGAFKVAQGSKERTDADGYRVKTRVALRSDGKVLRAIDTLSPERAQYGSRGWNRGGYSIAGALPARDGRSSLDRFMRYCKQHGFEVKVVAGHPTPTFTR